MSIGSPDNEERRLLAEYETVTRFYSWAVVLAPLQQFVLRVDLFNRPGGVVPDKIFHHHHVAGLRHGKVGFRRNDQTESLQLACRVQLTIVAVQQDFADISRSTLWRNGPHDIGQILWSKLGGGLQFLHVRINLDNTLFALNPG